MLIYLKYYKAGLVAIYTSILLLRNVFIILLEAKVYMSCLEQMVGLTLFQVDL